VLVFVLAFLPSSDTRYMYVMRAEVPGPVVGKLVSKIKVTARILYVIYIVMTVLLFVFLLLGGMPVFDSIVHAIATAGTGGFSIKNSSIAFYDSAYIDYVVSIFMVLFGINFNLFYFMIIGRVVTILKDEELKFYLGLILISILAVSLNTRSLYDGNILTAFRYASFQVTSIVSTSGFATADFTQWPFFSQFLIIILMLTGGCAGSTAGGIKIRRFLIFIKMGFVEIKKLINPRSVVQLKVDSKVQQDTLLSGIAAYFSIYVLIFAASTMIISLDAKSADTTLGSVLTCLSNVGPGFGAAGPSGNFSIFSSLSKFVLMVDMLVGRLELFPIILLFTPNTWRRV
jgi:trk system potassium uptake protein TrkH